MSKLSPLKSNSLESHDLHGVRSISNPGGNQNIRNTHRILLSGVYRLDIVTDHPFCAEIQVQIAVLAEHDLGFPGKHDYRDNFRSNFETV